MLIKWLKNNKIDFKKIKSIYSEFEPCQLGGHECKKELKKLFSKAKVEYNYKYSTKEIRKVVRDLREIDLNKLIKS